jgi:hypothetical protein
MSGSHPKDFVGKPDSGLDGNAFWIKISTI